MLDLKPTHKPILNYFAELAEFEKHGHSNEMTVRNAFQDLLQFYSKKVQWQFIEEYPIKRKGRRDASVDGALLDQFSLPRAFWEAKDTKDDLPTEVQKKFADGYPSSNILFWQPGRAILIQEGRQVMDADISRADALVNVLEAFFNFDLPYIKDWESAVQEFKDKIPTLAEGVLKILDEQRKINRAFRDSFDHFLSISRASINPDLSVEAVEEMLIQHLLTRRIFRTIFKSEGFLQKNAVARELEGVVANLVQGYGTVDQFLKPLDRFYVALEQAAESTDEYAQKQTFLNTVYEKFFQGFAVKVADTHGIVYTPQPIVDFMVRSVESALQKDFGKSLANEGVHILDPFVGTGNFILRVMREIHEQRPQSLRYKYLNELHCNEVMLLPYYIACLNIEHLYMELTGEYLPFPGICLVDTFELVEDRQIGMFTSDNTDRVQRQKDAPIFVVIGNPPYNAGQVNENDNNKNRKYPAIDKRVHDTYSKDSTASSMYALQDPYVKAFRMASDRVLSKGEGIVCYVTNNGYLDGIAFDGMRKHLRRDFDLVSILDLGGNVRKNPKLSGTTHNVFGIQVGVSISLLEHHIERTEGVVRYARMDEFWTRQQKNKELHRLDNVENVVFESIVYNGKHHWLTDGMEDDWDNLLPLGTKESKSGKGKALFSDYSRGLETARDSWVYNFNQLSVEHNVRDMIDVYNTEVARYASTGNGVSIDAFVVSDSRKISWSSKLKELCVRGVAGVFQPSNVRHALYRPFSSKWVYTDPIMTHRPGLAPRIFPLPSSENIVVCVSSVGQSKPFHTLATNAIPDLHLTGDSQCFPLYLYDEDGSSRRDNITDWGLAQFQTQYNDMSITKLDVFHYAYGILHDPAYRTKYAANLKRELPRIPFADDLKKVAEVGKRLMEIHVNYEEQPEYPLNEVWSVPKGYRAPYGEEATSINDVPLRGRYRVVKMKRNKKDPTQLIVNDFLTLTGIPANVDDYKLGNRSALDWIIDQYQISTDKRSGITNDPNRDEDLTYIVRLIKKIVTVSMETIRLVSRVSSVESQGQHIGN
jgi:predicted helicase